MRSKLLAYFARGRRAGSQIGVFVTPDCVATARRADAAARLQVGRYTRFDARSGPEDRIELRIALVYDDRGDGDGVFNAAGDVFDGLRLEPVHVYEWPE